MRATFLLIAFCLCCAPPASAQSTGITDFFTTMPKRGEKGFVERDAEPDMMWHDKDILQYLSSPHTVWWEVNWGPGVILGNQTDAGAYAQVPLLEREYFYAGVGYMADLTDGYRSAPMLSVMFGRRVQDMYPIPRIGVAAMIGPSPALAVCLDLISVSF